MLWVHIWIASTVTRALPSLFNDKSFPDQQNMAVNELVNIGINLEF